MKVHLFILYITMCSFISTKAYSQENKKVAYKTKNSFLIEIQLDIERSHNPYNERTTIDTISGHSISLVNPSFELLFNDKHSHEVIFHQLSFKKRVEEYTIEEIGFLSQQIGGITKNIFDINVSYIYSRKLSIKKSLLNLYLGVGVNYQLNSENLKNDLRSPERRPKLNKTKMNLLINPRIEFIISKKCFLECRIPVVLYNYTKASSLIFGNRQTSNSIAEITYVEKKFLPYNFFFSLGVGIKLF